MLCLFDSENLYDIICYSNKFWNKNSINCVRMFKQIFFFKIILVGLLHNPLKEQDLTKKKKINKKKSGHHNYSVSDERE